MTGVITKTDVVARIGDCQDEDGACKTAASLLMSRIVILCHARDLLHEVWSKMKARGLKNIPIVDPAGRSAYSMRETRSAFFSRKPRTRNRCFATTS